MSTMDEYINLLLAEFQDAPPIQEVIHNITDAKIPKAIKKSVC